MVDLGISEFTFGFAFLYEQVQANWGGLVAVPILPSLQREQQLGWDARLPVNGTTYYYQFKLSEYLSRSNASFIADGTYNSPYYRISFHRRNNNEQHQRLWSLGQICPTTYYVAPELDNLPAFDAAFLSQQLTNCARLIPIRSTNNIIDSQQHFITYQAGSPVWMQHSRPQEHQDSFAGRELHLFYKKDRSQWKPIDKPFAIKAFSDVKRSALEYLERDPKVASQARKLLELDPVRESKEHIIEKTSKLVSVVFGANMVIVGEPEERSTASRTGKTLSE